ncbi:hypothetical protein MAR_019121, partial [Mya arenaria]
MDDLSSENNDYDFNIKKCIFCLKGFSTSKPCVMNPNISKLDTLFQSCKARADYIGSQILANQESIKDGSLPLRYHRNCRATYQSLYHQSFSSSLKKTDPEINNNENVTIARRSSSKHLTGSHNVSSVVKSLELLHMGILWLWRLAITERKAVKYYDTNLKTDQNNCNVAQKFRYRSAAFQLKEEYADSIMNQKNVYKLTDLRKRFIEIAREDFGDYVETYRSFYFKILMQDVWPELTFVYQNGKSDLVCSKDVTVGEALRDNKELEQSFHDASDEDIEIDLASDESIVHKAVGVLRKRILRNTETFDSEYFSVDEMSLSSQKKFVDPLLYKMICWMANSKDYENATEIPNDKQEVKLLALACDVTSLVTSIQSPMHLGLTVHLYNEFGSRHLIEDMNSLGYEISYSELRMFLSSAAEHAIKTQCITETGGLVPYNITHKCDGGQLVVGVADNLDHNEKTTDGKGTTHAMTSILVSPKISVDRQIPRLQRSTNRSFDKNCVPGGSLCNITPYRKPINRPCPTFEPVVSLEEVNPTVTPAVTQSRLKELLYSFGQCSVFCADLSERSVYPLWDMFHAKTMFDATASVSNVAFNPIIMATPTDYSTIYTVLLRLKECMNVLGQQYAPVIFDMSMLAKALE